MGLNDESKEKSYTNLLSRFDTDDILKVVTDLHPGKKYHLDEMVNFVWEKESFFQEYYFDRAKDIMRKSQDLVIIGYSFPNFNREIDNELIKCFIGRAADPKAVSTKRIYIQDTKGNRKEYFEQQFGKGIEIIESNHCDEFLIPPMAG